MIVIHGGAHLSALGISSSFTLALPDAACRAGKRYPYVLCLHDDAQDSEQMLRELCCHDLADTYRFALLLPNGQNSCFLDMAHGPKWQSYLLSGLLPFAERSFPLSKKPSLLGVGTGGWAAARLAGQFPEMFSASAAAGAQPDLPEAYALGRLAAMPDLMAAFGDPKQMGTFALSPETRWFSGRDGALMALRYLTNADGSATA